MGNTTHRQAIKIFSLGKKSKKNWRGKFYGILFCALGIYGFSYLDFSQILGTLGFSLKEVIIEGHDRLKSSEILKSLGVVQKAPLFGFSLEKIQQQTLKNPWIRSVAIQRQLPDTLYMRIVERRPLALWKEEQGETQGRTIMIDDEGELIHAKVPLEYENLPIVLGEMGYKYTPSIIKALQEFPEIFGRVTGLVWVGGRRWDLILDKKLHIQLPETGLDIALKKLETLQMKHRIFDKSIVKIDLRIQNKTILKPSPNTSFNMRGGKVVGNKT
jgi:cell division protein FtsQ